MRKAERESSDMTCAHTGFAPLNDVQRTALSVALGSAARVETALRILDSIRSTPARDSWFRGRYLDHLAALEQIGVVEYEPGLFTRHGNIRYRARLSSPNIASQPTAPHAQPKREAL